jgi:hypothetical protein
MSWTCFDSSSPLGDEQRQREQERDQVTARIAQRLLALTAAIWHNRATGQPVTRSLIAYDH